MQEKKIGVFTYKVQPEVVGKRIRKKIIYTYLLEFSYSSSREFVNKANTFMVRNESVYFAEYEDGYYVYIRNKKRELTKGLTII